MTIRTRSIAALAAALLASAIAGSAGLRAEDAPNQISPARAAAFDATLVGGAVGKAKTFACFVRRYDADHLAAHPKQKVSAMTLLVAVDAPSDDRSYGHNFKLGVTFRHRKGNFESGGFCRHASMTEAGDEVRLHCGVDCEGGGIEIGIAPGRKPQNVVGAMVRLESVRIWDSKNETEDADYLKAGTDDKAFRLERTRLTDCETLVSDDDDRIAMRSQ